MSVFFVCVALAAGIYFFAAKIKPLRIDPKRKSAHDRLLLKELLEGFGLEVPAELNDEERAVMKSIKSP